MFDYDLEIQKTPISHFQFTIKCGNLRRSKPSISIRSRKIPNAEIDDTFTNIMLLILSTFGNSKV